MSSFDLKDEVAPVMFSGEIGKVLFWPFVLTPRERQGVYEDNRLVLWWLAIKKACYNIHWWLYRKLILDPRTRKMEKLGVSWSAIWRRPLTWEEMDYMNKINEGLQYPFESGDLPPSRWHLVTNWYDPVDGGTSDVRVDEETGKVVITQNDR